MPVQVQTETKGGVLSDLLLVEIDYRWSRQAITLAASSEKLGMGTVLEYSASTGAYSPLSTTTTGESGSQTITVNDAVAVLLHDVPANAAKQSAVALLRGAVVQRDKLVFGSAITADMKKTACAALTALGVVVKE